MYKKSSVMGVPKGEEGLVDPVELGRRIKAARVLVDLDSAAALARALTARGCESSDRRVSDWERGVSVPTITAFFAIVAVTAPPGGLKFFAKVWPDLWPLIERGLNGQPAPREGDDVEPPEGLCPNCSQAPVSPTSRYGWCQRCTRQAMDKARKAKS